MLLWPSCFPQILCLFLSRLGISKNSQIGFVVVVVFLTFLLPPTRLFFSLSGNHRLLPNRQHPCCCKLFCLFPSLRYSSSSSPSSLSISVCWFRLLEYVVIVVFVAEILWPFYDFFCFCLPRGCLIFLVLLLLCSATAGLAGLLRDFCLFISVLSSVLTYLQKYF